ncbi:MAG: hypothetical protein F7C36_01895 [Desulfurococcales archaeon]|nr:hypothetical protein [Desulfurococcales archaeon]
MEQRRMLLTTVTLIVLMLSMIITPLINVSAAEDTISVNLVYNGRVFLEEQVCCRGIPIYIASIGDKVGVIVYYSGNHTSILYIVDKASTDMIDKRTFDESSPLCMEKISNTLLDIVFYRGSSIEEYIYDLAESRLIPGFRYPAPSGSVINGCTISNGNYMIYGSKIDPVNGYQNLLLVLGSTGNKISELVWGSAGDEAILDAKASTDTVYVLSLNATSGDNLTLYSIDNLHGSPRLLTTIIGFKPIGIDTDNNGTVIILGRTAKNTPGFIIYNTSGQRLVEINQTSIVFLNSVFIDKDLLLVAGYMYNQTTQVTDGVLLPEPISLISTYTNVTPILVTGKDNVSITSLTADQSTLIVGGLQGYVPFIAFYNIVIQEQPTETTTTNSNTTGLPEQNKVEQIIAASLLLGLIGIITLTYILKKRNSPKQTRRGLT